MLSDALAVTNSVVRIAPRIERCALTLTPGGSTTSVGSVLKCGAPCESTDQPGTSVQCAMFSVLSWFVLPSGRCAGTCSSATGVGLAGAMPTDAAISSPFRAQVLDASPVTLISLSRNSVG